MNEKIHTRPYKPNPNACCEACCFGASEHENLSANPITKELVDAGIIPPNCFRFEILSEPHDVMRVRCDCYLTEEQWRKVADILLSNRDDAMALARTYIHNEAWANEPSVGLDLGIGPVET